MNGLAEYEVSKMGFDSNDWTPNVVLHPAAQPASAQAQRKAFDALFAQIHEARARELRENFPSPPSSESLVTRLMAMPALDADQLSVKLRLFALELSKEAEFGQNPDLRLIPYFASIQRDCAVILRTQTAEEDQAR